MATQYTITVDDISQLQKNWEKEALLKTILKAANIDMSTSGCILSIFTRAEYNGGTPSKDDVAQIKKEFEKMLNKIG